MIEQIWKYRAKLYIVLMVGVAILAMVSHLQSAKEQDSEFIRQFRQLNASFWPPDIIPHPNLPEPYYPTPSSPSDVKSLIDLV